MYYSTQCQASPSGGSPLNKSVLWMNTVFIRTYFSESRKSRILLLIQCIEGTFVPSLSVRSLKSYQLIWVV